MTTARASGWFALRACVAFALLSLVARYIVLDWCPAASMLGELCGIGKPIVWLPELIALYFGYYAVWGLWMGYVPGAWEKWSRAQDDAATERARKILERYE